MVPWSLSVCFSFMSILFGIAWTFLDKDKMWTILAWTVVLYADPDPLPVAGWRDHVLEARALYVNTLWKHVHVFRQR